jgi:hypothetical protein
MFFINLAAASAFIQKILCESAMGILPHTDLREMPRTSCIAAFAAQIRDQKHPIFSMMIQSGRLSGETKGNQKLRSSWFMFFVYKMLKGCRRSNCFL